MPSPLILFTLAYVVGIVAGDAASVSEKAAQTLFGGALLGLCFAVWHRRWLAHVLTPLLLLFALAMGMWAQARRLPPIDVNTVNLGEELVCEGHITSGIYDTAGGQTFRLAVDRLRPLSAPAMRSVEPPLFLLVTISGRSPFPLLPGDRVRIAASLSLSQGYKNPGSVDRVRHLLGLGVSAVAYLPAEALLRWDEPFIFPSSSSLGGRLWWLEIAGLRAVARLRATLLAALKLHLLGETAEEKGGAQVERYGLISALILGDRGPLLRADALRGAAGRTTIEASFRAAGIYHILSVSGLHLAIAGWLLYRGIGWLLLFVPGLPQRIVVRRFAAALALPAIGLYTLLTGAELPTVRAAVAASLGLLAVACGRHARLPESLALAVLFIAHPGTHTTAALLLFEPSLVLSMTATLAIAYLQPLGWLIKRGARSRKMHPMLGLPLRMVDASLAATLCTVPLCAYYFSEAQPAGVLGNLLVVPVGEFLVLPFGLFGTVAMACWPTLPLGGLLVDVSAVASGLMLWLGERLASLGLSSYVPAPMLILVVLFLFGLAVCAFGRLLLGVGLAVLALGIYLLGACLPTGRLQVTFLDVGQGDATVIELPHGGVIVIDAGLGSLSPGGKDLGELVVGPFLRRRGHRRIELLIASHRHPDHIGGLQSLIAQFPVRTIWMPPGAISASPQREAAGGAASPSSSNRGRERDAAVLQAAWQRIFTAGVQRGARIEAPHDFWVDGLSVEVLGPCREPSPASQSASGCSVAAPPNFGENDSSLVLRLGYGGRSLLFPGDLELSGELLLLEHLDEAAPKIAKTAASMAPLANSLAISVLKAPHHCSRTSSSESFISAIAPLWVVCSVGRKNRFGFPHAEVLDRYLKFGSRILRTDEDGAITATFFPNGRLELHAAARSSLGR